jgi:hypothetical protein
MEKASPPFFWMLFGRDKAKSGVRMNDHSQRGARVCQIADLTSVPHSPNLDQ